MTLRDRAPAIVALCFAVACSADATTRGTDAGPPPAASIGTGGGGASGTGAGGAPGTSGGASGSGQGGGHAAGAGSGGAPMADDLDAAQDPTIFCKAGTESGESIVVPCVTYMTFSRDLAGPSQPQPGGSPCSQTFYNVRMATNELQWTRCSVDPNPLYPWHADSGSRYLSDTELADLLKALQAVKVSKVEPCGNDPNVKRALIQTRTDLLRYADNFIVCPGFAGDGLFVDHLTEALAALDALAH